MIKFNIIFLLLALFIASCSKEKVRIPDENFEKALIKEGLDSEQDGFIVLTEKIAKTTSLNISSSNIRQLTGIEYFTGLKDLDCSNNKLESLDISKNSKLEILDCSKNYLNAIDVSSNANLKIVLKIIYHP